MTQTSCSDFISLKGMAPVMVWRWGTIPWVTSRITAAWTKLVWAPFPSRPCWVRLKWLAYFARADSSLRDTSPSSKADSTAASQARIKRPLASLSSMQACRMARARSWRCWFPSCTEMAASLASIMMWFDDAWSRVARVLESAALSSRARLSRKLLRRSSS